MLAVNQKADANYPQQRVLLNVSYIIKVSPAGVPGNPSEPGSRIYMKHLGVLEVVEHVSDIEKMVEEHERSRQLIPIQIPH